MTAETIIKKAQTVVIKAETQYVKDLTADIKDAEIEHRETEHDLLLNELIKEGKRLHKKPTEEYDEEEVIIYKLNKK